MSDLHHHHHGIASMPTYSTFSWPVGYWCVLCFDVGCVGRGIGSQSNTGVTGWLGKKDSNPVGGFAFSDPVSWHSLPRYPHPPPTLTLLPNLSRQQSRQHLHISQQINSFEHNPRRELSNALCGPPSPFPSSILPPTRHTFISRHASHSSLIDSWHSLFPKLPRLARSLLQKSLQPLACHDARASQRNTTCVFCIHAGSNLIEHSPFRSVYKSSEQSGN